MSFRPAFSWPNTGVRMTTVFHIANLDHIPPSNKYDFVIYLAESYNVSSNMMFVPRIGRAAPEMW